MLGRPPGRDVYYAGEEAKIAYRADKIASRGILRCAPVANKLNGPDGRPIRMSEKPVTLVEYLITTLVRQLHVVKSFIL